MGTPDVGSGRSIPVPNEQDEPDERTYRELQADAKERGLPANQSADELTKAIDADEAQG